MLWRPCSARSGRRRSPRNKALKVRHEVGNSFPSKKGYPMSGNTQILLMIWAFWIAVAGLDLMALLRLRRLAMPAVAAVLWTVWIIVAPIVGAVSFFLVVRPAERVA